MSFSVHMIDPPAPDDRALLCAALDPSITIAFGETPPSQSYVVLVAGRPPRELLEHAPHLRALVIPWAGLPPTTRELLRDFPHLTVHNLHHNAIPTAEMALALLLAAAKWLIPADRAFRTGNWIARYEPYPAFLLHGNTALILGYGAIGQHITAVLRALGMTVLATRRSTGDPASGIYPAEALHDLLPRANVLLIALPGTPATEGLIGADELALLPRGSLLVNIGRGLIVDQHALYDALRSGQLAAAASDVWYTYPRDTGSRTATFPADAPLHELDNMVMSPHRAGMGGAPEIEQMRMTALAHVLNTLAAGDDTINRVDISAGY